MHRDLRAMRGFEFAQHRGGDRHVRQPERAAGARRVQESAGAGRRARVGLVYPLEPQEPVLEIACQRLDRDPRRERLDNRGAQTKERLVRVVLGRPLVDQLREVADDARARRRRQTASAAATASARCPAGTPGPAARVRDTSRGRRSSARARLRTGAGSAVRSSPPLASCRGPASGRRRCDPTHRACRSAESARRW